MTDLFTPIALGDMQLPNRIFMAPMTRNRCPDNVAGELQVEYYRQRATSGLLISEGAQISTQGVGYPATPGIHNDAQVAGWRSVTDAVHETGGHIFCQLWHCGRVSHPDFHQGSLPVAPSAIRPEGQAFTPAGLKDFVCPRELQADEIQAIIADYVHAASCADRAGFDGVEIHGANGYLIDQFLRDGTNRRTDDYGGTVQNRARFLTEVTAAVVDVLGASRVGVRLSPRNSFNDIRDSDPETTFTHAVEQLNAYPLAYLHITEMNAGSPGSAGEEFKLDMLHATWRGSYVTNGGYDRASGNAAIAEGRTDAVAFGVPYIANPDLVERMAANASLNSADESTFYGGDEHGYTDYPQLGS